MVLVALAACETVGEGPPCGPVDGYPYCSPDGTQLLRCENGEETPSSCATGTYCLDLADDEGLLWSRCVTDGSVPCDADDFVPSCLLSTAVVSCQAPTAAPEAGATTVSVCPSGSACVATTGGATCQEVTVPPEPCDPTLTPASCQGTVLVYCDPATSTMTGDTCPEGTVCGPHPDNGAPACVSPSGETCDPATYVPVCDGDALLSCGPPGVIVSAQCPMGTTCRETLSGAACVQMSAETCDPGSYTPQCMGMRGIVRCDAATGFTVREPCPTPTSCVQEAGGAVCR